MEQVISGLYCKTYGKNHGFVLVLLHGYLESSEVWDGFAELMAEEYFVICIDLPGHGRSALTIEPFDLTVEYMADKVISVLDNLKIKQFHILGHSMGGYVCMALLQAHSKRLNSAVLLHSHCYNDSDEKKENRGREIDLIKEGKKEVIVRTSIPRLFSDENAEKLAQNIENSKIIALKTSERGIISALTAMKSRPDRSAVLANSSVPVLLVGGRKDNLIPFEMMEKMKLLSPAIKLVCLENSGHMGFIEQKNLTVKEVKGFLEEVFECE